MSTFEVGIKGRDYDELVVVKGVSHITTVNDVYNGNPVEVLFFSKKKGKIPDDILGTNSYHKVLLAVPYSELSYYKRQVKK